MRKGLHHKLDRAIFHPGILYDDNVGDDDDHHQHDDVGDEDDDDVGDVIYDDIGNDDDNDNADDDDLYFSDVCTVVWSKIGNLVNF